MESTGKQRKHRFLKAELAVLVCLACFWAFKSGAIPFTVGGFLKGTPATTKGNSSQRRDLSTPSSRLEGHWRNEEGTSDLYHSITQPSLNIGYFIIHNKTGGPSAPLRFKILFEKPSGTQLVIRPYGQNESLRALSAKIGMEIWISDVTYTIPKHGQSMTQEGTFMGDPILSVYRYVDDKTSP